jgi:hypothetical protein
MESTYRRVTSPEADERSVHEALGPWGVYGEAIGNPKFHIGRSSKESEFLQAADEFMVAHEDVLRELAKH